MQRSEFIASQVQPGMVGLEVGPGHAPAFPKAAGWSVETLDHVDATGLRAKYAHTNGVESIEEIDYVSDGRPIDQVVPRRRAYDFIYASHVIEHIPDPIAFIRGCEPLLKTDGRLILAVPDKRRCFDALRSLTSTGDFIDAYAGAARVHSRGNTFDFYANVASLDGNGIWESDWRGCIAMAQPFEQALSLAQRAERLSEYTDIHAWRFTPSSFRLIFSDMNALGLTLLRETVFVPTNRFEFFFSAGLTGVGCTESRLALHHAIAQEQIDGYQQIFQ